MRRIGLFGGTFDPPHVGHLVIAEWALERLRLDEIRFVPAGQPPHKPGAHVSRADHRLAMARLAVRGNPAFKVSALETRRGGPSFTVETLRRIAAAAPRARLFLILGADSLSDFAGWREPDAILRLATLAVAPRPGAGRGPRAAARRGRGSGTDGRTGRVVWLDNPEIGVSSRLVRARVRARRSIRYLVPDAVATYIARHRLYRARA